MRAPDTICWLIHHLGGRGLGGALAYVAGHQLAFKCEGQQGEWRGKYPTRETAEGCIDYDVGLTFRVNGPPGQGWRFVVAYEPDDVYSVWLWRLAQTRGDKRGEVLAVARDVYADALRRVVECMYDDAIQKHCLGFIPAN